MRYLAIAVVAMAMVPVGKCLIKMDRAYRPSDMGGEWRQSECETTLRGWHNAQRTHHAMTDTYDPVFSKVGYTVERRNTYTYFAGRGPVELRDTTPSVGAETATVIGVDSESFKTKSRVTESLVTVEELPAEVQAVLGVKGTCPQCQITAACAANLDKDSTLDVWVISTGPLPFKSTDGEPTRVGFPIRVVDDWYD